MTLQIIVLPPLRNKRKVSPLAPKLPAEVLTYITSLIFKFRKKKRTPRYDYHVLHATSIYLDHISVFFGHTQGGFPDHPPQKNGDFTGLARKSAFSGRFCTICMCRCKAAGNSKPKAWPRWDVPTWMGFPVLLYPKFEQIHT